MDEVDVKAQLHDYLRGAREVLVWKLEGLDEYDIRRPLTPTGTNLLGLVKHSTAAHIGYFGEVFGRPTDTAPRWSTGGDEPNAEFWATPDESREDIVAGYRAAWALADATIDELALEAAGTVWWWGDAPVTLHQIIVHVIADTQRHAGHADILRELIDGSVGLLPGSHSLSIPDAAGQERVRARVQAAADELRRPDRVTDRGGAPAATGRRTVEPGSGGPTDGTARPPGGSASG